MVQVRELKERSLYGQNCPLDIVTQRIINNSYTMLIEDRLLYTKQ